MIERAIDKRSDEQQAIDMLTVQQPRPFEWIVIVVHRQRSTEQVKSILAAGCFNTGENMGVKRVGQRQIVFARSEQDADLVHGLPGSQRRFQAVP